MEMILRIYFGTDQTGFGDCENPEVEQQFQSKRIAREWKTGTVKGPQPRLLDRTFWHAPGVSVASSGETFSCVQSANPTFVSNVQNAGFERWAERWKR
jgi:hypothetical protein